MTRSTGTSSPGSPGSGGGGGGPSYGTYYGHTSVYDHAYFHCGVPVWKVENGDNQDLVFGALSGTLYDRMSDGTPRCVHNFFTYNPTAAGKDSFEFPFMQSGKGVLCNWFSGSESVSQVLSQLLGNGLFYGFPWTPAVGYTFRKPEIPKLVFVFTNEFDNEICRQDLTNKKTHSLVAVPVLSGKEIGFNPADVGYDGIFPGGWKHHLSAFDQYCVSWIKSDFNWEAYLKNKAGIGSEDDSGGDELSKYTETGGLIERMLGLGIEDKEKTIKLNISDNVQTLNMRYLPDYHPIYDHRALYTSTVGMTGVLKSFKKTVLGYPSTLGFHWDIRKRDQDKIFPSVSTEAELKRILTDQQVMDMKAGRASGTEKVNPRFITSRLSPEYTNTIGFYELRNVISRWTSPVAGYLFTSDGSVQMKEVEGRDPTLDDFYLYPDNVLFRYIKDIFVPEELSERTRGLGIMFNAPEHSEIFGTYGHWRWKAIFYTNMAAWAEKYASGIEIVPHDENSLNRPLEVCDRLSTILGTGDPRKRTTIVWAWRKDDARVALNTDDPKTGTWTNVFWKRIVFGLSLR